MRPRSLAIFALLVAALAAFVWFWERKQPGTAEREADAKKVLAGVAVSDVRELVIARGGAEVRLVREGGQGDGGEGGDEALDDGGFGVEPAGEWRLAAPLAARADRFAVEGLLSSLLQLEKQRTLEDVDRADYGLAPPAATATLVTAKGRHTLEIGSEVPGGDQRVVALAGGDTVWTVPGAFWSEIAKEPGEWRSRQLFPGQRHEVERIALRRGDQAVVLARRGGDFWLEAPLADRADREPVEELLTAVAGLEAVEFLDAPAAEAGLETPEAVVEVVRQGQQEPFRIALGPPRGEGEEAVRVARVDGQLVAARLAELTAAVQRPPAEWRSRGWSALPVYDVDRVEATDAEGTLTLVRSGADWDREGTKIFYAPVSDLLTAVADARATELLAPAAAAARVAGPPALTLRLVGREGRTETLRLWPAGEGGAPARVEGRELVLLLPPETVATLAGHLRAVRQAEPLPAATAGADGDDAAGGEGAGTPP